MGAKRILLIDDEPTIRDVVTCFLSRPGYELDAPAVEHPGPADVAWQNARRAGITFCSSIFASPLWTRSNCSTVLSRSTHPQSRSRSQPFSPMKYATISALTAVTTLSRNPSRCPIS